MGIKPISIDSDQSLCFLEPSFTRIFELISATRHFSLARALQYEVLSNLNNLEKVLDFGGGDKAGYRKILKCVTYNSVNIDAEIEPTWVIGIGEKLPCMDQSFDHVLTLNTLEHIFDAQGALREMYRVLRPSGCLLISTPFLYPIHGHPDDFFRPTPSWYFGALGRCGFRKINIIPLSWGPFSTALICSGTPGPAKKLRKNLALALDLVHYYLKVRSKSDEEKISYFSKFAPAFLICARK